MRYVLIAILVIVFALTGRPEFFDASIPYWTRAFTYHFLHANIFHLAVNCLSLWFIYQKTTKENVRNFLTAFAIATLMYCTAFKPVIGISNVLFASIGLRTPAFNHPWWRKTEVLVFFAVTFLMLLVPQFSAFTHITSLACGILVAEGKRGVKEMLHGSYTR